VGDRSESCAVNRVPDDIWPLWQTVFPVPPSVSPFTRTTARSAREERAGGRRYLHQVNILSAELVLGQILPVHYPRVPQDLDGREALMRVHVKHL